MSLPECRWCGAYFAYAPNPDCEFCMNWRNYTQFKFWNKVISIKDKMKPKKLKAWVELAYAAYIDQLVCKHGEEHTPWDELIESEKDAWIKALTEVFKMLPEYRSKAVREFTAAGERARAALRNKENPEREETGALPTTPVMMTHQSKAFIMKMIQDELKELSEATTIAEQVDALEDIKYYIDDCLAKHGVDGDELFQIVHQANLNKMVDGKVILDEDPSSPRFGKVLKPEGWTPPDVESYIAGKLKPGEEG